MIKFKKLNTEIILYAQSNNVPKVFFIIFLVQKAIQEFVWLSIVRLFQAPLIGNRSSTLSFTILIFFLKSRSSLKSTSSLFRSIFLHLGLSRLPHDLSQVTHFRQEYYTSDIMSLSGPPSGEHVMAVCLMIGLLLTWSRWRRPGFSARPLLVMNRPSIWRYFQTCKYRILIKLLSSSFKSIH